MDQNLLLLTIVALLSANLLLVGSYIVLVLKDARETIKRVNHLLDTTNDMADAVAEPVIGASRTITALSAGLSTFNIVRELKEKARHKVSSLVD